MEKDFSAEQFARDAIYKFENDHGHIEQYSYAEVLAIAVYFAARLTKAENLAPKQ